MRKEYEELALEVLWVTDDVVRCSPIGVFPDAGAMGGVNGNSSGNSVGDDLDYDVFG